MNLSNFDLKKIENEIQSYLDLEKSNANRNPKSGDFIGFVEGPPTLNGEPHLGHLRGRIIKDVWFRFKTLQNFRVIFRAGWDTQGLPIELQAEKILGLSGSKSENLKLVGIEKIVETCKQLIQKNSQKWIETDKLLGLSFDYKNAYWTYRDEYIEREWQYLKKAFKLGILREWYRVVAYCPSCQTSLSNAEVNQGYKNVEDPSFYYKVKLEEEQVYLIVWTTMPFTIITDEMIGVNPDTEYAYIEITEKKEVWVIASARLEYLLNELGITNYKVLKVIKGQDFEGKNYIHPLLHLIPGLKKLRDRNKIHQVVSEKFVDGNSGSGLVHIAPANGEEDFDVAIKRRIPIFVPINDDVKFTDEAGIFQNRYVRDTDTDVINEMKKVNSFVKLGRIKHQYPTCWRSGHKIVWLARREYFYMIDMLGDKPYLAASKVEYFFESPKNRYLEIIREKVPWCISRERIWGTPLPVWLCGKCGHKEYLFSRNEIISKAIELPDGHNFELHRPWIDKIRIKCLKCNANMNREPFVLDTWHNSGASPYAAYTDAEYDAYIPTEFLTEGIDQTRGWAYTLLIENVIMKNSVQAPFKSFLFQGHVLDKNGNKMSKSLGNVIDAYELLSKNSTDLIRFYFMWKSSPIDSLSFNPQEMVSRPYQVLSTLYYLHVYLSQNSSYDKFNIKDIDIDELISSNILKLPERWILSKLQHTIELVTIAYEKCKFNEAARILEDFVINNLSQFYVPLTRDVIWDDSNDTLKHRNLVYSALGYILSTINILLHPIAPFITEYLYLECFKKFTGVLDESWPQTINKLYNTEAERSLDLARKIISLSNGARMKAKIKRRWPLEKIIVCFKEPIQIHLDDHEFLGILKTQLNVNRLESYKFENKDSFEMLKKLIDMHLINLNAKLKTQRIAPRVRAALPFVMEKFENMQETISKSILYNERFCLIYPEGNIELTSEDIEITYCPVENYEMAESESGDILVFLSIERSQELLAKAFLKDIARNLQQFRKEKGYIPTAILPYAYVSNLNENELKTLEGLKKELAYLVRVKSVILSKNEVEDAEYKNIEIDGRQILVSISGDTESDL
jgi:isoleucyl-tRNA synthetase